MRTQIETDKTTKTAYQGQAGTYLIQGELGRAREASGGQKGPVLAMVGKLFKASGAAGQQVTVNYLSKG
jgi:hypothetical protein